MLIDFVIFLIIFLFLTAMYFASKKAKKEINTIIDNQNKENEEVFLDLSVYKCRF
jgi:regulatory protein YycI of two-component signal transduction system YycFG